MPESFRSPAKVARRLKLTGLAIRKVVSWPRFMFNYTLGFVPKSAYEFRNGARLKIGRGLDHVPIIEIFLREDYGAVQDGSVVLDLGANVGAFSVYAAASARSVSIYAYEPMPEFFRLMQENIRLNDADGIVTCFNCAVGGNTQPRDLVTQTGAFFPSLIRKNEGDIAQTTRVPCTTLANILEENSLANVSLLKMDCEGAEYEILYNTPASYTDRIKQIRMEYHNLDAGDRNADSLLRFLQNRNYRIERYAANERVTGTIWARQK